MTHLLDMDIVLVILTTIIFLGSSRIEFCIRLVTFQGIMLGIIPIIIPNIPDGDAGYIILMAIITISIKGVILPWLLFRAWREANVSREVEPYVGFGASLIIGVVLLGISFFLSSRLQLPLTSPSKLIVPLAFLNFFAGIFAIASRRKALTQVLGYLILENGIYIFGITFVHNQPLLVEMGVLLDLLVGVFIMGITIFNINREFEHIDTDRLNMLKDAHYHSGENFQ